MTIPGIHSLTALTILAVIGTIDRFETPDSLANYAGMVPRMRSSCQRTRHGKVTKKEILAPVLIADSLRRSLRFSASLLLAFPLGYLLSVATGGQCKAWNKSG